MEPVASRKRLRNWAPVPNRAEVKADAIAETARKVSARKDRRTWCKGKPGREHQPAIVFVSPPVFRPGTVYECEWRQRWYRAGVEWCCHHQEHCTGCGKILRSSVPADECPAYPGSEAQKVRAEAEAAESDARVAAWRTTRRPVITGPQGYRRRRAS